VIIQNLEQAEEVVNNHPQLTWVGWTIAHLTQDDGAEYTRHGVYNKKEGKWFRRISYPYISGTGWVLPNSLFKE
jgi:hypothetical protein